MKFNIITSLFYILILLFILRFLYYLCINYKKEQLINDILVEWKKTTNNGFIKKARNNYANHYYLSFSKYEDSQNHIHFMTNHYFYDYYTFVDSYFIQSAEIIPTITL